MVRNYKRKTDRQSWSAKNMGEAISEIIAGRMGFRKASILYCLPRSTLEERVKRVKSGMTIEDAAAKGMGRKSIFSAEQEKHLLPLLKQMTNVDFRRYVYRFAEECKLKHRFDDTKKIAGLDWHRGFLKRHLEYIQPVEVIFDSPTDVHDDSVGPESYIDGSCFQLFLGLMKKYDTENYIDISSDIETTRIKQEGDVEHHEQTESEEDILNKYIDDGFKTKARAKKSEESTDTEKSKLVNGMLEKEGTIYKKCNGTISPPSLKEIDEEGDALDTPKEEKDKEALNKDMVKEKYDNDDTIVGEQTSETKDKVALSPKKDETNNNKDAVLNGTSKEQCEESESKKVDSDRTVSDKKVISDDKIDIDESKKSEKLCAKTEKPSTTQTKSDDSSKSGAVSNSTEEDSSSSKKSSETKTDSDNNDDDDLLCVMEEKSLEEANENKDESSCSASEKDDEAKDGEENNDEENNEETNEETNDEANDGAKEDEETEEANESQVEMETDAGECAMDIEESDIGGVVYAEESRVVESERSNNSDSKVDGDKDANKENENGDVVATVKETSPVKENGVVDYARTNGIAESANEEEATFEGFDESEKDSAKKSTKRQLSDSSTESEIIKKIRLEPEAVEKELEKEKRPIKLLDNFRKFMLDKKLKSISRFELEELCIQKMCECVVNKSEIGELRQKIMIQEQTIDTWRKEAVVVAKQTRDLKIVHERLMADLKLMREQTGKPLVPVKITRSVGLQAIIENPPRIRPAPIVNAPGPITQPQRSPVVNQQPNKTVASPQNRQLAAKPKTQPQRVNSISNRPLQPISQKDNVNTAAKTRQSLPSPQAKKNADPKAVIDLTDEDEKNQTAKQATNTASPTVRILNKQGANAASKTAPATPTTQASKIMFVSPGVLPRNSAVMVKMNSNGLVTSANGITTIPNGQVSVVTTPVVRTVSQVRVPISSVSTARSTASAKQPIYKHPAPLPAAPNYQNSVAGKKPIPPRPHLNLTRSNCGTGIVLQWKMPYKLDSYETIVSYQLYAYQETKSPPKTDNWGKIGDVKALELPMAVTLTQFAVGNRYFFAVRAVDGQKRLGPFSDPENILL